MKPVFSGNPFATAVGQRIDQATDTSLTSENWAWNMEICDMINESEDGPKDAVRAIRKKLQNSIGKNYIVVQLTLTILETCVKNCGRRFHQQIATKDFLLELIKILTPKYDAPTVIQDKVLSLIQSWAAAFQSAPDLKEVGKMYADLKAKGIEFPVTEVDSSAPIHTPGRTVADTQPSSQPRGPSQPRPAATDARVASVRAGHSMPATMVSPSAAAAGLAAVPVAASAAVGQSHVVGSAQVEKLRADLEVVQGNCRVFNEMLNELGPGSSPMRQAPTDDDLELLRQLESTCRQMQLRVMELLERVSDEKIIERLLHINDDLNNVFVRYERFERYRNSQSSTAAAAGQRGGVAAAIHTQQLAPSAASAPPTAQGYSPPVPPSGQAALAESLIDFCSAAPVTVPSQPRAAASLERPGADGGSRAAGATASTVLDDEFDMLALSRQPQPTLLQPVSVPAADTVRPTTRAPKPAAAVTPASAHDPRGAMPDWKDAEELESWLSGSSTRDHANVDPPHNEAQNAATSSEFDEFLRGRAVLGDALPGFDTSPPPPSYAEVPGLTVAVTPAAAAAGASSATLPQQRARQMQKDESDKTLFAL